MIALIQKSFKTRAYRIFMWAILLALGGVFSFVEVARQFFGSSGPWVASVNGAKISQADFIRQAQLHKERIEGLKAQYPEYADMILEQMGAHAQPVYAALDSLIKKELLQRVAQSLHIAVAEEKIYDALSDIRFVQQELSDLVPMYAYNPYTGSFNMQQVHAYLQRMGLSIEDFHQRVLEAVARDQAGKIVTLGNYVPEFELKNTFAQDYLGKRFTVLSMNASSFLPEVKKKRPSDQELQSFYATHKEDYRVPEKRVATAYTFTAQAYDSEITEKDVKMYYEKNKAQYVAQPAQLTVRRILIKTDGDQNVQEARQKAERIYKNLLSSPQSFAQIAKAESQEAKSAAQGGLLEPFTKGTHEEAFERAAYILKEDGALSPVIKTKEGFQILQRVNKKSIQYKPIESVKKEIEKTLATKRFEKQFAYQAKKLLDDAGFTKEKLAQFAKNHNATEKKHTDLTNNGFPLSNLVFSMKKGETKFAGDANHGTIATLTDTIDSYVPSFEKVKEKVEEDWYFDQAVKMLGKTLKEAQNKAEEGDSLKEFKKYGSLEQTSLMKKSDLSEVQRLEALGVPTKQLFDLNRVGAVFSKEHRTTPGHSLPFVNNAKSYTGVVVRLNEIEPFDQQLFEEKKEGLRTEYQKQKGSLSASGFIASLYRNATINTNNELLQYQ